MTRTLALACTACLWLTASPTLACDTTGRLDVFDLAERADEVFVGRYVSGGSFAVLDAIEGQPDGATQLRPGPRSECAPRLEPGAVYLVLVRAGGAPVGAYRSAVRLSDHASDAPHPLIAAVRAWLAERAPRRRRAILLELLEDAPAESAREAVLGLSVAGWWRPLYARRLEPDRCRAVRSALDDLDVEWNQAGLRRRVTRDLARACPDGG